MGIPSNKIFFSTGAHLWGIWSASSFFSMKGGGEIWVNANSCSLNHWVWIIPKGFQNIGFSLWSWKFNYYVTGIVLWGSIDPYLKCCNYPQIHCPVQQQEKQVYLKTTAWWEEADQIQKGSVLTTPPFLGQNLSWIGPIRPLSEAWGESKQTKPYFV